jgi:predicted HD superfamily hydrolase involved in NAD metabolism
VSDPTYEEMLEASRAHYGSEGSLSHARRVAEQAAALAERYGVDPQAARLAGLVHDWARDMDADTLVEVAREHDLPVSDLDREVPYLLHAQVGEVMLRERFPDLPEQVTRAVAAHTCGAGRMDDLAKVVYVADMIEPERDFDGVHELRDAVARVDLHELFRRAYTLSVQHLVETRRHIHPDTVAVWNAHVADRVTS